MPLNIRIQWIAGTACVSECVLKTLACRGLRVGPSKTCRKILGELYFCTNTCGACIRTRANTGKYFWGIIFEICIRTFADMYYHLRPLCLYGYSGCIHTPLMPIHKNIFGELFSGRIHAAHAFAPGRIQENTPGELFMYWFCARGYYAVVFLLHSGQKLLPTDFFRINSMKPLPIPILVRNYFELISFYRYRLYRSPLRYLFRKFYRFVIPQN